MIENKDVNIASELIRKLPNGKPYFKHTISHIKTGITIIRLGGRVYDYLPELEKIVKNRQDKKSNIK